LGMGSRPLLGAAVVRSRDGGLVWRSGLGHRLGIWFRLGCWLGLGLGSAGLG